MRGTMKAGTWGGRKYRAQIKSRQAEEAEREKFIQKGLKDLGIGEARKLKISPAGEGRLPARQRAFGHTTQSQADLSASAYDMGDMEQALLSQYEPPQMPVSYTDLGSNLLTGEQIRRRREIQTAVGSVPAFPDPSKMEETRDFLSRQYDAMLEESRQTEVGRTRFDGVVAPATEDEVFDTEALVEQAQGVAPAQMIEDDEGNIVGQEYGTEGITIGQGALGTQQAGMDVVETYEPETKPDVYERWQAQKRAKAQMDLEAKPSKKSGDELSDLMGGMVVQSQLEKEVERRGLLPDAVKLRPQSKDIDDDFSRSMVIMSQMGARNRMEAIGGRAEDLAKELESMNIDISKPAGERDSPALVGLMPNVLKQSTLDMRYDPMESKQDRRKRLAQAGKLSIVQLDTSTKQIADPTRPPLAGEGDAPTSIKIRAKEGEGTQSLIYGREQYGAVGRTRPLGLYDEGVLKAQKVKTKTLLTFVDASGKPVPKEEWSKLKPKERKEKYGEKKRVKVQVEGDTSKIDPYFGGARGIHQIEKKKATKRRDARRKHKEYLERLQREDPQKFYDEAVKFNYGAHEGREDLMVSGLTAQARARPQSTAEGQQPALRDEGLEQIAPIGYVPLSYAGGDLPTGEALDREFIKDEVVRERVDAENRVKKSKDPFVKRMAIAKKKKKKKALPSGLAKLAKGL